jgi:dipeptidyl aminopeptidase/acylaminoacyl peptidase
VLVAAYETPTSVGDVVAVDLSRGTRRTVFEANADLVRRTRVRGPDRVVVPSDGFDVDVAVLRPTDATDDEALPTIFALHGGPADAWGGYFTDIAFLLASSGYQVAMPNVRGSIGYGRAFAEAERADYGGGELRDLLAVVDAMAALPGTNSARLGIVGGSHGGYLTAWAVANSDRFAAAVCACPVIDLRSTWAAGDGAAGWWADLYHGGPPWERQEYWTERSPLSRAHRIRTPVLIVHGEDDHRCPVDQGEMLFSILHRVGSPAELVLYPNASHGFAEPGFPRRVRADYFERLISWFDQHLRR